MDVVDLGQFEMILNPLPKDSFPMNAVPGTIHRTIRVHIGRPVATLMRREGIHRRRYNREIISTCRYYPEVLALLLAHRGAQLRQAICIARTTGLFLFAV